MWDGGENGGGGEVGGHILSQFIILLFQKLFFNCVPIIHLYFPNILMILYGLSSMEDDD